MKKIIYSILTFLLLTLSFASTKAQTYCNQSLRFCMATSYYSWDMQTSNTGFYGNVTSGITYSASIEPYGADHYGFIWILYNGGSYSLESSDDGWKSDGGTLPSTGYQSIEIFA